MNIQSCIATTNERYADCRQKQDATYRPCCACGCKRRCDMHGIFILLVHFSVPNVPTWTSVLMVLPLQDRAVIDINDTVHKHRDIIHYMLAAHELTGCYAVATYFGIGKAVSPQSCPLSSKLCMRHKSRSVEFNT